MSSRASIETIIAALKEWGGYFTFSPGSEEEEYVVMQRSEFDRLRARDREVQLALPDEPSLEGGPSRSAGPAFTQASPDAPESLGGQVGGQSDALEKINRDLGEYQLQREDEEVLEPIEAETPLGEPEPSPESSDIVQDAPFDRAQGEPFDTAPSRPQPPKVPDIRPASPPVEEMVEGELPAPRRVRFEPLRGDLPPELQE